MPTTGLELGLRSPKRSSRARLSSLKSPTTFSPLTATAPTDRVDVVQKIAADLQVHGYRPVQIASGRPDHQHLFVRVADSQARASFVERAKQAETDAGPAAVRVFLSSPFRRGSAPAPSSPDRRRRVGRDDGSGRPAPSARQALWAASPRDRWLSDRSTAPVWFCRRTVHRTDDRCSAPLSRS